MQSRRLRGFTLIELMLAIGVMAVLAAISWRGVDAMVRSRDITEERSAQVLALQSGLAQWAADLDAMEPTGLVAAIDWDGQVLRLTRRASASDAAALRVVAWTRRADGAVATPGTPAGGRWLRWESTPVVTREQLLQAWDLAARWAQSPDDTLRRREVPIAALAEWQVFYYRGDAWTNPLSSAAGGSIPSLPAQGPLAGLGAGLGATPAPAPDGVRLVLQLPEAGAIGGRLQHDWAQPTAGGGKS